MIPRGFARDDEYPRHGALPARGAQSGLLDGARKNSTISAMSASPSSSLESASTRMASGNGSDNALSREQQPVGRAQLAYPLRRKSAPAQPNQIEAEQMRAVAAGDREGKHIALDAGESGDEGVRADACILMHGAGSADHRVVRDSNMTAKQHIIGKDHAFAEAAIMRHMAIGQ